MSKTRGKPKSVILYTIAEHNIEQYDSRNVIIRDLNKSEGNDVIGYYPTIVLALTDLLDMLISEKKQQNDIKSLITCINEAKNDIIRAIEASL